MPFAVGALAVLDAQMRVLDGEGEVPGPGSANVASPESPAQGVRAIQVPPSPPQAETR